MTAATRTGGRMWVVITDYPRWPSPYFAQLHRHAPPELGLLFRPDLDSLDDIESTMGPGIINLHRLKRLYRDASGARTLDAARSMLDRLASLRARGWRLVWTVHNVLPDKQRISTPPRTPRSARTAATKNSRSSPRYCIPARWEPQCASGFR